MFKFLKKLFTEKMATAYEITCPSWMTDEEFSQLSEKERVVNSVVNDIIEAAKGDLFDQRYVGCVPVTLKVKPFLTATITHDWEEDYTSANGSYVEYVRVHKVEVNGYELRIREIRNHPNIHQLLGLYTEWKSNKNDRLTKAREAEEKDTISKINKGVKKRVN